MARHFLLVSMLFIHLIVQVGCTHDSNSQSTGREETPKDGGADGSGTITGLSTIEQVRRTHERTKIIMMRALGRIEKIVNGPLPDVTKDPRWPQDKMRLLNEMMNGNERQSIPVSQLFVQITWNLKETEDCDSTHGPSDGAAKLPNIICVSTAVRFKS